MPRFHEQIHGVYFDDLDPFGILHNARYLLLFERTLGSFWMHMGFGALQDRADRYHFVRANTVEYLRPVVGTGQARVRVQVEQIGSSSLTFGFSVMPLDQDTLYARGSRVVVRVDPQTWRPTPWTDEFRSVILPWLPEVRS